MSRCRSKVKKVDPKFGKQCEHKNLNKKKDSKFEKREDSNFEKTVDQKFGKHRGSKS